MLARFANDNELIAHDCGLHGNPSHTGVDDLEREYSAELRARMMLYHYASVADGQALAARGTVLRSRGSACPWPARPRRTYWRRIRRDRRGPACGRSVGRLLARGLAQVRYRSRHHVDGQAQRWVLRSSLWRRHAQGWRVFHQGTPQAR